MRVWKTAFVTALLLAGWACGGSRSQPVTVHSEGLEMAVSVDPAEPRVGSNAMWIELRDGSGAPVTGADVDVEVKMHAMGAMPAMGGPAGITEVAEGRYRADFELDMGGTWNVEIGAGDRSARSVAKLDPQRVLPDARTRGVDRHRQLEPFRVHRHRLGARAAAGPGDEQECGDQSALPDDHDFSPHHVRPGMRPSARSSSARRRPTFARASS